MRFEHFMKVFASKRNDISKKRLSPSISKMNTFMKMAKDFSFSMITKTTMKCSKNINL